PFKDLVEERGNLEPTLHLLEIARRGIDVEQRVAPGVVQVGIRLHAEQHGRPGIVELGELLGLDQLAVAIRTPRPDPAVVVEERAHAVKLTVCRLLPGPQNATMPGGAGTMRNAVAQLLRAGPIRLKKQSVTDVNAASIIKERATAVLHHLLPFI